MINPFIENYRQRWDFVWKRIVTFLVMDSLSGDQHQRQPTSSPHSLTQEEALAAVNKCITELEQLLAIQTLYTAPVHSRRMWLSEICRVLPYHRYFSSQIASRCLAFIKNVQWTHIFIISWFIVACQPVGPFLMFAGLTSLTYLTSNDQHEERHHQHRLTFNFRV